LSLRIDFMPAQHRNNFPKLHNAAWPGVVGKGPDSEPPIDLETMLDHTAAAEVDGVKFDGVDLFLFEPHVSIDASDDDLKRLADSVRRRNLLIGTVVAPVWPPTGGGSAMGDDNDRKNFVDQVRKGCRIARRLRELGVRPYGVVRIDSAASPSDWVRNPKENTRRIADTFRQACDVASDFGERLAAEGEICWGGMHSWREMVRLLEQVNPRTMRSCPRVLAGTMIFVFRARWPNSRPLCVLGPSTSTWPRTTRPCSGPARTTRLAGTACRATRVASLKLPATPAIGSATSMAT
jgi:hypothetical protein